MRILAQKAAAAFCILAALWVLSTREAAAQAADALANDKNGTKTSYMEDLDLTKNEFRHETKAGAIFTTGNTESLSATGNSFTLYRVKRFENKWRLGFYFNKVDSNNANPTATGTIANYIYGFYRLDYYFLQRTTFFVGGGGYVDEIKGIDLAANAFAGISHYWLRTPKYSLNTALGYDYTHEDRVFPAPSVDIHAILFSISYQHQFKDYLGFAQNVIVLENGGNGRDVRVNSDTELKVDLTKHFGLVFGFHLRFDNEPVPGFEKLDTISDISLAITFGGDVAKPCP